MSELQPYETGDLYRLMEKAKRSSHDYNDDKKVSFLIERKVTSVQTETKGEKAAEIRRAIEFHLRNWLNGLESIDPKYRVSELIQVGSVAEGTKIKQPDEFDYLAVVDELSKPGTVVTNGSEEKLRDNLVTVALVDDNLKSKWNKLCKDGNLQCFQHVNYPKVGEERFGHVFISYLTEIVMKYKRETKSSIVGYGSAFEIYCKIRLPTENNVSLVFKGAVFRTPNIFIEFEVGNMEITVDLSPAIRYYEIEDCFKKENCCGQAFADLVLCRNSLLLVGTDKDSDFKVTVTEAEVEYMRSVMKFEHRIIYILLKYIKNLYYERIKSFQTFTSYMLKTVCIHHDTKCKSEQRSLTVCLKAVIEDLDECRRQNYVVSAVNRQLHLDMQGHPNDLLDNNRKCMLEEMLKLFQLPEEVDSVEKFDTFLINSVKLEEQRRDEEQKEQNLRDEILKQKILREFPDPVFQTLQEDTTSHVDQHAPVDIACAERQEKGSEESHGISEPTTSGHTCEVIYTRTKD